MSNKISNKNTDNLVASMLNQSKTLSLNEMSTSDEAPTMLEIMMKEQAEALKQKEKEKEATVKKEQKTFGGGFKKGFFGSNSISHSNKEPVPSSLSTKKKTTDSLVHIGTTNSGSKATICNTSNTSNNSISSDIPLVRKTEDVTTRPSSLVLEEVHEAMKDSTHPMVNKLQQGDWMTPDLMEQFKHNPIIAHGMASPKCVAAMQLLQSNPTEAKNKFKNDVEVSTFLAEFGRIMATHFEKLGGSETSAANAAAPVQSSQSTSKIAEIGPLQAEALSRAKTMEKRETTTSNTQETEDKRVQEVLADEELRSMLMDPELQRIIQECNSPVLLRKHMQNPVIAYKIKKLCSSGLLGIAN